MYSSYSVHVYVWKVMFTFLGRNQLIQTYWYTKYLHKFKFCVSALVNQYQDYVFDVVIFLGTSRYISGYITLYFWVHHVIFLGTSRYISGYITLYFWVHHDIFLGTSCYISGYVMLYFWVHHVIFLGTSCYISGCVMLYFWVHHVIFLGT